MERRTNSQLRQKQYATSSLPPAPANDSSSNTALALAMSRDGSSGGTIRMCVITEDGVERRFVPGDQLPKFWEGQEVLGKPASLKTKSGLAPMAVEPL